MTPKSSRANQNILDLRKIVAEQRAAAVKSKPRFTSFAVARKKQEEILHRPVSRPRDWLLFRRELLKFALLLVLAALLTFGGILATRLVSAKSGVESDARSGLTSLQSGFTSLGQSQPVEAAKQFADADRAFTSAQHRLSSSAPTFFDGAPIFGAQLRGSRRLLDDAQQLALIGKRLSALLPPTGSSQPAVKIETTGIISGTVGGLTDVLQHRPEFVAIVDDAVDVIGDLESISPNVVPASMRARFASSQKIMTSLTGTVDTLKNLTSFLVGFLAPSQAREYLVVFQNNDELRPTGGFTGTYLLVKFDQGGFKILDAPGNGPFSLSDVNAKKNLPPQPILAVAPYWTFHDANWYLDAPTSAKTMLSFYAQDRGFTPDGVVFLTPGIMEDLLRITGPVRPEHYQVDISADNFVSATEQQVEFGYDKALNNPKQFLIDLVPLMLTKISTLSGPDAIRAAAVTLQRANQGDLIIDSSVPDVQNAIKALGWDGSLLPVQGDALAVVDTNLGGGKTDRSINETVNATITLEGSTLKHVVAVTRKNNSSPTNQYNNFANRTFIRVYAPPDAQFVKIDGGTKPDANFYVQPEVTAKLGPDLLKNEGATLVDDTNGYRITHESGRMVFGAWSRINPGESQTVTFTYTTPAPDNGAASAWRLDWQHQPGATLRSWNLTFIVPKDKRITDFTPAGKLTKNEQQVSFTSNSLISRTFTAVYK